MIRVLAIVCLALLASSQGWSQDITENVPLDQDVLPSVHGDSVVQGQGVALSDSFIFRPKIAVESGVDTNVFYEEDSQQVSPLLRLIVALSLDNQKDNGAAGTDEVLLNLGTRVGLLGYLADDINVRNQSNLAVDLGGGVIVWPDRDITFSLSDRFARTTRPRNFESSGSNSRIQNVLNAGLKFRPFGRALGFGLRFKNFIDIFEGNRADFADRMQNEIGARIEWNLFPVSTLSLDASYGFYVGLGDEDFKQSSNPLRIRLGLATPITEYFGISGYVGFGKGFYSGGQDFTNVIGALRTSFKYSDSGNFSIGYMYDFRDSINANFYRDHAVDVRWKQDIFRMKFSASVGGFLRGYRGISGPVMGPPERDDVILFGRLTAHYLLKDWLSISGQLSATSDQTDYQYSTGSGTDDPSYTQLEAMLGISAAY